MFGFLGILCVDVIFVFRCYIIGGVGLKGVKCKYFWSFFGLGFGCCGGVLSFGGFL